jgi:hypothetical protein
MRIKTKPEVICLTELGYCFFHNGTHLLKISKRKFIDALESDEKSALIAERYPDFFNLANANEARSYYEKSSLLFSDSHE